MFEIAPVEATLKLTNLRQFMTRCEAKREKACFEGGPASQVATPTHAVVADCRQSEDDEAGRAA